MEGRMNSLKEYRELFRELDLTELSVTQGDFHLSLKREGSLCKTREVVGVQENSVPPLETGEERLPENMEEVKAPLLGIFNLGTGQGEPVRVGDSVQKGDVLCTIEAMKMFNEVTAPIDGVVCEICAEEGELVEYNRTLFRIRR